MEEAGVEIVTIADIGTVLIDRGNQITMVEPCVVGNSGNRSLAIVEVAVILFNGLGTDRIAVVTNLDREHVST